MAFSGTWNAITTSDKMPSIHLLYLLFFKSERCQFYFDSFKGETKFWEILKMGG